MGRPTTLARNGMVVTPHYLASQAGLKVLQDGGNAVQAAIAAAAAIAVVYPHGNAIGGDNFWLIYDAAKKEVRAINASGRSGSKATLDYYASRGMPRIPARGYAAANTVPGAISGWDAAFAYAKDNIPSENAGIGWSDLLRIATGYASDGFPVSVNQANRSLIDFDADDAGFGNIQRFADMGRIFCPGGKPHRAGEILVQEDLGRTLEVVAAKGADAFYKGEVAEMIARDLEANDGILTLEDFHTHTADWVDPITVSYRGYDAFNLPPNTQGMAHLGALNILKNFDLSAIAEGSADYYHLMAEVVKEAFRERDRWVTDPAFLEAPLSEILSDAYGQRQAERIKARGKAAASDAVIKGGDTVWIGVVDKAGNAVSLIQSICDGYGSGIIPSGTGVIMQNRGKFFNLDTTSPNRLEPRKRTFHTLIAGMLLKDGALDLVYGTMGGEGQPQTQTALVTRMIDYGMEPQAAIEAPRWLQGRFLDLSDPATRLNLEGRISDQIVQELRARGHSVAMTTDYADMMGHAGAIRINRANGVLHAGADPRGDGAAVGF